jgi:hypothetical protein
MKIIISTIMFIAFSMGSKIVFAQQQTVTYCWQGSVCQQVTWASCVMTNGEYNAYCRAVSHQPVPFNLCNNSGAQQC